MIEQKVPDKEIGIFWAFISRSVNSIVSCLDGLDEEDLNWRPPSENANSLYVLPTHMMGNVEEVLLGILCSQDVANRQRESEFRAVGNSNEPIKQKWKELREKIASSLAQLPPDALDREYVHPRRGKITGREILIIVATHAAEQNGQAKLTRDLLFTIRGRPVPKREY
jgi:hypothetical protein